MISFGMETGTCGKELDLASEIGFDLSTSTEEYKTSDPKTLRITE